MIRGKRLIVAGDEQQLPPTSFFKSVTEPSEDDYSDDDEKEDLESILVECQTSSFPKCMLKWHYRSKDEHLIAFSNKHLYRELYTFPSSVEVSDITGIKWHYYENTEHNEKNALQTEARMVAKAAIEHAKRFPTRTLAVATFNVNQKSLIEDEINEVTDDDASDEENVDDEYYELELEDLFGGGEEDKESDSEYVQEKDDFAEAEEEDEQEVEDGDDMGAAEGDFRGEDDKDEQEVEDSGDIEGAEDDFREEIIDSKEKMYAYFLN